MAVEEKNGVDWAEVKRPNPHFFKVLVGDFAKSMKIPPKFLKHLREEMEAKPSSSNLTPILTAILEGPTGRTWHVKVEKTVKGVFFTSGWTKFIKDHSLEKHELLIFRYNGCMQFTVLIFDKSACEKEDACGENEGRNKLGHAKRKLHFDEAVISSDSSEEKSNEEDDEEVIIEETSKPKGKKAKAKGKKGTKQRRKVERLSTRRPVTEKEKKKAQKAAHSFASENPFFVIRLTPRHVYYWSTLRFPVQFSRRYLPRTKCNFVLRVSSDKVWDVNYIPTLKDRDFLSKGWLAFAKENTLEEDDFCAFELVKSTEFQVHIYRVVEVPTPSKAKKNLKF